MSYQIKSTPYFRRMFNNSRKNGQLQRLREEYERIQEFNDRTIELKMRQVRLKRLFREIEEIKETSAAQGGAGGANQQSPRQSHHHHHHHLLLSAATLEQMQHNQRLEALARAKQLGKEISRRNAQLAESGGGGYLRSELRMTAKMRAAADARKEAADRKERAAKRISYGNAQSKSNMARLGQRQLRQCAGRDQSPIIASAPAAAELEKRAQQLQQRLRYGNARSGSNMARVQAAALGLHQRHHGGARHRHVPRIVPLATRLPPAQRQLAQFSASSSTNATAEQPVQQPKPPKVQQAPPMELPEMSSSEYASASLPHQRLQICAYSKMEEDDDVEDEEEEMHTAPLAASNAKLLAVEAQPPRRLCRKETRILRHLSDDQVATVQVESSPAAGVGVRLTSTVSNFDRQPLAARSCTAMRCRRDASERWHQISLTLPWFKAFNTRRSLGGMSLTLQQASQQPPPLTAPIVRMGVLGLTENSSSYDDMSDKSIWQQLHQDRERTNIGQTATRRPVVELPTSTRPEYALPHFRILETEEPKSKSSPRQRQS